MKFENIEQIKKEFDITENDPKEIRKKLRVLIANLHPDKHGGDFATPEDKEKYLRANQADEFLEKLASESSAIVPSVETTELVKLVHDLILVNRNNRISSSESRLSEQVQTRISQVGKKYLAPKLAVSTITGILTFVWLLPGTISEHPILKYIVNITDPRFLAVWVTSILTTIIVIYGAYINEERQKQFQAQLKTDVFQNEAFMNFLHYAGRIITKQEFVYFLTEDNSQKATYRGFHRRIVDPTLLRIPPLRLALWLMGKTPLNIDLETAQIIADIVFERAENRGIRQKDETAKDLQEVYISTIGDPPNA